jgi:peptidoglycan/LPS O-acetylase OafA/YrhL
MVLLDRLVDLPLPFKFWFQPIILEFVFGVLLGSVYLDGMRLPRMFCGIMIGVGIVLFVASGYFGFYFAATSHMLRPLIWGVPALLIVAGAVLPSSVKKPNIVGRAMARVGDASYSIYLFHIIAISLWGLLPTWMSGSTLPENLLETIILVGIIILVSLIVYVSFERPMTVLLRKLLSPQSQTARVSSLTGGLPIGVKRKVASNGRR